jgi:ABC-type transport system involved in multi-copper enzyme maturation permease subunit
MNPPEASAHESPHWLRAWGGIWRLTVGRYLNLRHAATLVGMIALLVLVAFVNSRNQRPLTAVHYAGWICNFYLCFVIPVLVVVSGGGAIRDDMRPSTADYLFTRPVRRSLYLACRYVAHMGCTQADYLLAFAALSGFGLYRGVPGMLSMMPLLLLGQVAAIAAYDALGMLFGVLSARYVVFGLGYVAIVEFGIGNIPTQINRIAIARQVKNVVPFYSIHTGTQVNSWGAVRSTVFALSVACVLIVAVAGAIFSFREMSGGQHKED